MSWWPFRRRPRSPRIPWIQRVSAWLDALSPPERQRAMFSVLIQLAGIAMCVFAVWLVWIVVWGDWPLSLAEMRLKIVGATLMFAMGIIASTQGGNLLGGPVGRAKGDIAGKISFEVSDDDSHQGKDN